MTKTAKRVSLSLGIGLIAIGITAGAHAQDTNPSPGSFRRMVGPGGAGRGGPMGPGGLGGMLPMIGRRLGLTTTQRDQIKNIAESHRNDWKALADRALAARRALNDAVTAGAIDESLIRQRSAEAAAVQADVAVARAQAYAEVLQVLTADQKARLKTIQSKMKNQMKPRQDARRQPI